MKRLCLIFLLAFLALGDAVSQPSDSITVCRLLQQAPADASPL